MINEEVRRVARLLESVVKLSICALPALMCCSGASRASLGSGGAPITLSSLNRGCHLSAEWVGLIQLVPEVLLAECQGVAFVVRVPNNLMGHVTIDSEQKALEYVRFFSSAEAYRYFELDGMVEVFVGDSEQGFNYIPQSVFTGHLRPAKVSATLAPATGCDPKIECMTTFEIERPVFLLDGRVAIVHELVLENGLYAITLMETMSEREEDLGILHFGDL